MTKSTTPTTTADDALAELEQMEAATLATSTVTDEKTEVTADISAETPDLNAALAELEQMEDIAIKDSDSKIDLDALAAVETDGVIADAKAEAYAEIPDEAVEPVTTKPVAPTKGGGGGGKVTKPTTEAVKTPRPVLGRTPVLDALLAKLGSIESVETQICMAYGTDTLIGDTKTDWLKAQCAEADAAQKKVGEKFVNVIAHLANGARLQCYTVTALRELLAHGILSSNDLYGKYLEHPYSDGTARAQSGQLMQLLPLLGIARRDGQTLTLIDEAPMTERFRKELGIERAA